ncbi:hypothetical protein N656DRAFT_773565 [Canariomyces notabilis]|uniref:RRM domain-containing protein n=1 Tax=Canariomyces notabilis TaxID=2074819 RepID=A0AAN6YX86_9PEZI|nr:hypothetical protein N656DRAFT_773565 [Canariomyces arenarius]
MAKFSKKRQRTSDEDAADDHDAAPIVKKNKLDSAGNAKATKKGFKTKEPGSEPALADGASEPKPEKKEKKKDKKDKTGKKEKKDRVKKKKGEKEQNKHTEAEIEPGTTNLAIRTAPEAAAAASEDTSERPQAQDSETHERSDSKSRDDDKSKEKKKKKKKEKKEKTKQTATQQSTPQDDEDTITGGEGKQTRFICFVGNLPFTASRAAVERHFSSLSPISVRLLTQRDDPSKSRGIAFVEFGRYDHMKTCLAKFHHTEFDDGISPPRRINVELTAGGGGKTAARRDKIKEKNAKLNEERAQRIKKEKEKEKGEAAGNDTHGGKTQEQRDEEAIHPSRRSRVPYGQQK